MTTINTKKFALPRDDFKYFGYSCKNSTTCETLLTDYYKQTYGLDKFKEYDFKGRVDCYSNDAPDGNAPGVSTVITHNNEIALKDDLNSTFCACRVDYGWQGELCDTPSSRTKTASYMFFGLYAFMVLVALYRGRITVYGFKSTAIRANDARGFTLKCATLAHGILFPLSSLSLAIYYYIGPGSGKSSEQVRLWQSIVFQISMAITLLSLLVLTLAFVDIATSMKQLRGFQKARIPLILFAALFFLIQMILLLVANSGSSIAYVSASMALILLLLVIVGPGWMFYKFSASLLHEQNSDIVEKKPGDSMINISTSKQTYREGCLTCLKALCKDISDTFFNQITDSSQDTGSEDKSSTDKKNSRDEAPTDITPAMSFTTNATVPNIANEQNQSMKLGGSLVTVISQSDSETGKNARERSESKDSKVSLELGLPMVTDTPTSKSPMGSPKSKGSKSSMIDEAIREEMHKKSSKAMNSAVVASIKSGKSKKTVKEKSDRKVARFLSRVLQLSIRLGFFLVMFVVTLLALIPIGNRYFALSLNVASISLQTLAKFFQLFYAFMISDAILWFFSDVLKKEIAKRKRNSIVASKTVPQRMLNDSKEDIPATRKGVGSKTEVSKTSSMFMNGLYENPKSINPSTKEDGNEAEGTGNESKV